jgi:hypothetical protein
MRCVECKWWERVGGECRRSPPKAGGGSGVFPVVKEGWWCGEWGYKGMAVVVDDEGKASGDGYLGMGGG